jgi:DNA-binding MarR family transcriptional regulator
MSHEKAEILDVVGVGAEVLYLENQICFPMYAVSRLTNQLYTPLLKEMGLTYPQYLVMLVLWQHKELTVNEICSKLILETNTVTPLLKRLEQKGLIVRNRSMEDERIVVVSLSDKGIDLRDAALLIPSKIISNLNGKEISLEEFLAFKETIWKLLGILKPK